MVSLNACRYTVLALFVIFNAIICSVSAWNLGILRSVGLFPAVDGFLIFMGILGVLLIFPIVCIEQARKNALTSRVWFEALWVFLFWVFNLSGAAATSALLPDLMCEFAEPGWPRDRCNSTKILVAFLWLATVLHLIYLLVLLIAAIVHARDHPEVWHTGVPDFPWFNSSQSLARIPSQTSDVESQMPKGFRPMYTSKTAFTAQFPDMHPHAQSNQSYSSEKSLPTFPQAPATSYPHQAPKKIYRQATYDAPLPAVPRSQAPAHYPTVLGPGIPNKKTPARAPTALVLSKEPYTMTPKRVGTPTHVVSPSWPAPRPPPVAITQPSPASRRTRSGSVPRHRPPPLDLTGIRNL